MRLVCRDLGALLGVWARSKATHGRTARRFMNAHTIIECGGYGFVVVNHTFNTFPMTGGCCIGRSGPAGKAAACPV
jgi:pectin methylesterase-like acyl-CoA thioesterase